MKIAILTSGILPVPAVQGGAVENLIDFYLEYNEQHRLHDITVYSVWHHEVERHSDIQSKVNHYYFIKVTTLYAKLKKKWFKWTHSDCYYHYTIEYFLHEAIKDIRKQQYDIILLENRPGYALKLRNVTNAQLVYHLHNEKLSLQVPQCQAIYNAATNIITVSNYIRSLVLAINPHDTKTQAVYNGIDTGAFTNSCPAKPRADLGLRDDDFVLLFSGRITQEKGIMELIEAMNLLKDYPRFKLLVVGSSFYGNADNKNAFADELRQKAETIKDRIIFTGFIPYREMPQYLKLADVAVIPSVWDDPFPTTVLEAQATGLPIISTRRGGIPEEVTLATAILLDTDQHFTKHLSEAIIDLYNNPEKRKTMAEASLIRSKLFDKETYAKNFFAAIE